MGNVRTLLFILAALTIALTVAFELATMAFLRKGVGVDSAPGLGGPYLALLDGILLYSVILIGIGHLRLKALTARIASVVSLILSFFGAIGSFVMIFIAFTLIMLMIGLLLAAPFGTLAYLAAFAGFPKGQALAALGFIMLLKLVFLVLLVLSDLGYLKNKGLLILIGLSLLATWLTSFLIALPPSFLSAITDAVGALITAVISFIHLIIMFIMSIIAILKALKLRTPTREV